MAGEQAMQFQLKNESCEISLWHLVRKNKAKVWYNLFIEIIFSLFALMQ